ncbi:TRIGALACTOSYLDIACYLGLYCEROL 4, chloroplastic-like protein [Drosera capensis]
MRKLRWVTDGESWDLDVSTTTTLDGIAVPLSAAGDTVPLEVMQVYYIAGSVQFTKVCHLCSKCDWLRRLRQCLADKSLYAAGVCSDILLTPSDTLLVSCEAHGDTKTSRKKALFHHQFPKHNLTMGAVWPDLFIDKDGTYWDVPFSMAMDLASITSDSWPSYHYGAFSFKKNADIWRSEGAVATTRVGENSVNSQVGRKPDFQTLQSQHGNFQRLFLDLTCVQARLDFSSGSKFLSAAAHLGRDPYNAREPTLEAVKAVLPQASFSLQQQIAGPFSFRVDSSVKITPDWSRWQVKLEDPVFAVEYALQVLGSAKAIAWCAPKHQEVMVELRFSET